MFKEVLIVCIGNICRSPVAEHLLRHALAQPSIRVSSAGLAARAGHPIDRLALATLERRGHHGISHSARQVTPEMVNAADLVLVMERGHLQGVLRRVPLARGKTFLMGRWDGNYDIPDPYRKEMPAFEHAYALIEKSVAAWSQRICFG